MEVMGADKLAQKVVDVAVKIAVKRFGLTSLFYSNEIQERKRGLEMLTFHLLRSPQRVENDGNLFELSVTPNSDNKHELLLLTCESKDETPKANWWICTFTSCWNITLGGAGSKCGQCLGDCRPGEPITSLDKIQLSALVKDDFNHCELIVRDSMRRLLIFLNIDEYEQENLPKDSYLKVKKLVSDAEGVNRPFKYNHYIKSTSHSISIIIRVDSDGKLYAEASCTLLSSKLTYNFCATLGCIRFKVNSPNYICSDCKM